jgi:prepilin-type N-terminal cleavage/methylation domain-containing protein
VPEIGTLVRLFPTVASAKNVEITKGDLNMLNLKGLPTTVTILARFTGQRCGTRGKEPGWLSSANRIRKASRRAKRQRGFTMIELAVVAAIFVVIASIALPGAMRMVRSYGASSSARTLASQLALAKMRAAEGFTQEELNCTLTSNSCQLETCTTKGASTCTTFSNDGGPVYLAQGISFGYGSITTPAGTQTTISNTTPIIFNSRGIPITAAGVVSATDAIYLTDQYGDIYAVTVNASGKITTWVYSGSSWQAL